MGVDAMVESVKLIKAGDAPKLLQDNTRATYEPPCNDKLAAIDWDATGREIYNLVRGCDPQPGAYAKFRGEKVRFYSARFSTCDFEAASGTVAGVDDHGIRIVCRGGELLVTKVRSTSSGKMTAREWAVGIGVKPGDRFLKFHG
jgi:methionyl-tRNA formyltransferase